MNYIFDTSSLVALKHFYPSTFKQLWERLDILIEDQTILSVSEVLHELKRYNEVDFIQEWANKHRDIFLKPTNEELKVVQQIFAIEHFQTLISKEAILKGTPCADPFVISAAKVKHNTVVTQERFKPNAAKIPNVCEHFDIPCIDLEVFMAQQKWTF